eukprot:scaffold385_cov305-Pinguiococcus_pyrenoidosus.AAC.46
MNLRLNSDLWTELFCPPGTTLTSPSAPQVFLPPDICSNHVPHRRPRRPRGICHRLRAQGVQGAHPRCSPGEAASRFGARRCLRMEI